MIDGLKKFIYIVVLCSMFFCFVAIVFSLVSCQSPPEKKDYSYEECYLASDCMYRNVKNPDKSVCSVHIQACVDSMKEGRIKQRLEYCSGKKFDNMTQNECRLYLNQK